MRFFGLDIHAEIDSVTEQDSWLVLEKSTKYDTLVWIGRLHLVISNEKKLQQDRRSGVFRCDTKANKGKRSNDSCQHQRSHGGTS